jgi:hypothetical protein
MKVARLIRIALIAPVLAGCSPSVSSHGFSRTSTNGVVYLCEVALIDNSDAPVILLSRSGGGGRNYALSWEMFKGRLFVDGGPLPLHGVSTPTIVYKEGGALRSMEVSESGVWLPLLRKNGPSAEELKLVFDEIEHGK